MTKVLLFFVAKRGVLNLSISQLQYFDHQELCQIQFWRKQRISIDLFSLFSFWFALFDKLLWVNENKLITKFIRKFEIKPRVNVFTGSALSELSGERLGLNVRKDGCKTQMFSCMYRTVVPGCCFPCECDVPQSWCGRKSFWNLYSLLEREFKTVLDVARHSYSALVLV